jgi:hypothetical protein
MSLFQTRIPEKRLHRAFKQILDDPKSAPVQDVILSWATGLLERRGEQQKFINEFQTTFNSTFWELYLNKAFSELGFSVDYTKASPDFCVTTPNGYQFSVEAVIADNPSNSSSNDSVKNRDERMSSETLKLAGKMRDKLDIFTGTKGKKFPYSTLEHVQGRPFVIAIAPFDSDVSLMQNNEIINRVLFGLDSPDQDTLATGEQKRIVSISKPSGSPVELGIFTNDTYKEVSAVLFSTTGTFGKAVIESGIKRIVRATRFREMSREVFFFREGADSLGVKHHLLGPSNYKITTRSEYGDRIIGADMHIYESCMHHETHLDGLHVYYNPFATIPLDASIVHADGITHNFYDVENGVPDHKHPNGALVSRQVYEPGAGVFEYLLQQYRFYGY